MMTYKNCAAILTVGLCAWRLVACSANTGDSGNTIGPLNGAGGFGMVLPGSGSVANHAGAGTPGFAGGSSTGNMPGLLIIKDSGVAMRTNDSSCGAVAEVPESITVYTDATVTDTTYTLTPVAIYVMIDRSFSMLEVPQGQSIDKWTSSVNSLTAFVKDPMSSGLDIGLAGFPVGANNTFDCATGADCGTPIVPIAALPNNAQPIINAMGAQKPAGLALTPTECALRGMINQCLQFMSMSSTGEKCVAVLVTDGTPTQCNLDNTALLAIITEGKAKGVDTYTLGLPGSDINILNGYAMAGGTGMAVDVSAGPSAFIAALNSIRGKVAHQEKHTVTTSHVVQTQLKCQWKIPQQKMGDPPLDPKKVNLQFTPPNAPGVQFGHVDSAAACPLTGNAWYFDNEMAPTQISLCPNTCKSVESVMGARIDILLHCPRIEQPPA
jgi:hypothetical protein